MGGVAGIEDYALVGDLQTAALVSRAGSIDWCCFPRFDSGACFAALLGGPEHGRWLLAPSAVVRRSTRRYQHNTLVLESVYETDEGSVRAIEFMPPRGTAPDIVRIVEGLDGDVPMRSELVIRFDFGKIVPWVRRVDHARVATAGPDALCLRTPVEIHGEGMTTVSEFVLGRGERIPFVLTWFPSHQELPDEIDPEVALTETEDYWLDWARRCDREGDYHEEIHQSLLLLKALTYQPTGGIVAAPTTSLPESIGGVRNWDYRFCWLRDATLTLLAISGSLRSRSTSSATLRAAAAAAPSGVQVDVYGGLRELPHFDPDLEAEPPAAVISFHEALEESAGMLLCVPEYAHGIPGAFKNALDWTVGRGSLYRKPVTVIKTSPPGRGAHARAALERVLRVLDADVTFVTVPVAAPRDGLDELTDPEAAARLREVVSELADRASRQLRADNVGA